MKLACVAVILMLHASALGAETIRVGMTYEEVARELKRFGITAAQRELANRIPQGWKVAYFPLEEQVDLEVSYDKKSETIRKLVVTFYPDYTPPEGFQVKGLQVSKELLSVSLSDGSYTLQVKKAEQGSAVNHHPPSRPVLSLRSLARVAPSGDGH